MTPEKVVQLPDLSQLPPWAVIAFGISLAVIFGLAWLGERRGKNASPANAQSSAQVAAVIVDPTALTAAAGEVAGLAVAVTDATLALRAHTGVTDRLADEVKEGTREMRELRIELRAMSDKMRSRG